MNKIKDKKIIAVLSYMCLLSLIPFFISDDSFIKFHSKQGIRLTIIYTPILLILWLFNKIKFLYRITDLLIPIVIIIAIVYSFIGIYDVFNNKKNQLPYINKLFKRR